MQPSPPTSGFVFLAAVILAIVAIVRSPRKLHTGLYILGAMLICALVATGNGFGFGSAAAAGTLAGVALSVGGIAASIERIRRYRKGATKYNVKPL